jgi:ABC-type methionine transport system ATPase subunit
MKKDIFIDNNIASKFSNPQDEEYKKLTEWLMKFNQNDIKNKDNYAHLVVSKKLLQEYYHSAMHAKSNTSIPVIIDKLQREGRLINISNQQIEDFKKNHFTKTIINKLRSNEEDRNHIPVVLLSDRKYVLTYDDKFSYDLQSFKGFTVIVEKRPEKIPYDK